MPLLEKDYNPGMKQGLRRLSRIISEEDLFMETLARKAFDQCAEQKKTTAVTLFLPKLATCHPALLSRLIRHAINHVKTNLRGITHDHIADIRHLAVQAPPGKHLDLPDRIRVYKPGTGSAFKKKLCPCGSWDGCRNTPKTAIQACNKRKTRKFFLYIRKLCLYILKFWCIVYKMLKERVNFESIL